MRSIPLIITFIFVGLMGTSCSLQQDAQFRQDGIGSTLYTSDILQHTKHLETYLGYLCFQSGMDQNDFVINVSTGDHYVNGKYPVCNYSTFDSYDWNRVVRGGFNDIDRRCDQYMNWLDNVKRRRTFASSQFTALQSLTNIILPVANASKSAIEIVAAAFGYASSTFNDYHDLLLLGIETSTIRTVVAQNRNKFRKEFKSTLFPDKESVVNVLQGYLRICTPHEISSDINVYTRERAVGIQSNPTEEKVQDAVDGSLGVKLISANDKVVSTPSTPQGETVKGAKTSYERNLGKTALKKIQEMICVESDGVIGKETRSAILVYKQVRKYEPDNDELGSRNGSKATKDVMKYGSCDRTLYKNFYERQRMRTPNDLKLLSDGLHSKLGQTPLSAVTSINNLRPLIEEVFKLEGAPQVPENLRDQASRALMRFIAN